MLSNFDTKRKYSHFKLNCAYSDRAPSFSLNSPSGGNFETADFDPSDTFSPRRAPDDDMVEGTDELIGKSD